MIVGLFPLTLPEMLTHDWGDVCKLSHFQQLLANPKENVAFLPSFVLDPKMAEIQLAWDHLTPFGGYPALVDESMTDEERYLWFSNYVRTYLERDVRDLANFRDLEPYAKSQRAVAAQTGQTYSLSTLSRDTGVSAKTVQCYLQYLVISY